ncbi:MAG TPA: asparagine synthase (glutamine-hydrolyzing) [Gaiellaceae bacterium]|nr:asparagine synthase (glutamine-hydrolyzing) [Gaiellaceae bacterium]
MCGIAGTLSFDPAAYRVTDDLVTRMRDSIAHRGPDGAATWVDDDGRVGLGFRRLAIIDLGEAAMQPMPNEDGAIRIVFNGEIYNHAEIRPELEQLGHRFRTDHSDTEVLVHGFEEWGIDVVHRLRGMFAFAAWDDRSRELWLVRDRIGIKPLYWSRHNGRLSFASEIKALLEDPQQERAVDEEALYHYLSFLTTPAPQTLFRGIRKLAGGTWLRVNADGDVREERYWDAWDEVEPLDGEPDDEIAARILDELRTSVRLRKLSDVPVGVFLSGGIDSSTNAALFSEGETQPIKTFSIGYEGDYSTYTNEFDYARKMAKIVGADHHERKLTQDDLIDFLPQMVRLQDEPIADPVCVPVYYVSKLARDNGVIVAQVGEGADELFWGYPAWKTLLGLQRYDDLPVPRTLKRAGVAAAAAVGQGDRREIEFLRRGGLGQPIFWSGAESFTEAQKQSLLSPRIRRELDGLTSWDAIEPIRRRFEARAWEPSHLNWMSYADLNLRLPELLLMRVDKMSMGVGLEGRVPFLDHRFVGLALSIPQRTKTGGGTLKSILKKAVRGVIPDELIDRPKQGFGVPVYEWLFDRLGVRARQELDEFTQKTDLLDRGAVLRLVDSKPGAEVWYLLNLALWWKEFVA